MGKICSVEVCDRPVKSLGLCHAHYNRAYQNGGDPGTDAIRTRVRPSGPCQFEGCGRDQVTRGYCGGHYSQVKRGVQMSPLRTHNRHTSTDSQGRRQCAGCGAWKSAENFWKSSNTSDGLGSRCIPCRKAQHLLNRFHLSIDQFNEMLRAQNFGCAICGGTNSNGNSLSVDHDHSCCPDKGASCGKCVRALLCEDCNRAIGLMRDDPQIMRKAADYLERFSDA